VEEDGESFGFIDPDVGQSADGLVRELVLGGVVADDLHERVEDLGGVRRDDVGDRRCLDPASPGSGELGVVAGEVVEDVGHVWLLATDGSLREASESVVLGLVLDSKPERASSWRWRSGDHDREVELQRGDVPEFLLFARHVHDRPVEEPS
jgi:hypothetical protein